jgi:hypothetical protein
MWAPSCFPLLGNGVTSSTKGEIDRSVLALWLTRTADLLSLRWRSGRTKERMLSQSQSYFKTVSLPPISSSWRKASWDSRHSNFIFQLNTCGYSPYATSPWRDDGPVAYNCCWPSPAQSFSSPSPVGRMTILCCLRFETPPTWRARSPYFYPSGTEWPDYTPRHWVSLSSPPTTRRATVEIFDPASTREPLSAGQRTSSLSDGDRGGPKRIR